jgi:hypothetical protein
MEAHALITAMPRLNPVPATFPALLLLVSGGHNMLVLCGGVGRWVCCSEAFHPNRSIADERLHVYAYQSASMYAKYGARG